MKKTFNPTVTKKVSIFLSLKWNTIFLCEVIIKIKWEQVKIFIFMNIKRK